VTAGVAVIAASVVYSVSPIIRDLAAWLTLPIIAIGGLVFKFPNESKQIVGRLLGHLAWLNNSIERESVRQDLEGTLSGGIEDLAKASPNSTTPRVRVEFLRSGEQVAALPDGTIVVGISDHNDRTRNLVAAAWAFARNAVLPLARPHLDRDVSRGLDFAVTKAILDRTDIRAVSEFIREIWAPAIENRARLKEVTSKLESLGGDRLLAPVLLEEFAELGLTRANRFPAEEVATETMDFVQHLFDLGHREQGAHTKTHFDGVFIKCGFVLLATPDVRATKGAEAYCEAVDWAIRNAYPRVYLMARGSHVALARDVYARFDNDVRVLNIREYTSEVPGGLGRNNLERSVTQIRVDVRQYVGIGQRPIWAVGSGYPDAVRSQRDRRQIKAR
jgi:hypothetical protein